MDVSEFGECISSPEGSVVSPGLIAEIVTSRASRPVSEMPTTKRADMYLQQWIYSDSALSCL